MNANSETIFWIAIYLTIFAVVGFFTTGTTMWVVWGLSCLVVTLIDFSLRYWILR